MAIPAQDGYPEMAILEGRTEDGRRRIAIGSGTTVPDVNRVVKQYVEMKKMLKMFKGKKGFKLPKFLPF